MKRGLIANFYESSLLLFLGSSFSGAEVEQLAKVANMVVVYLVVILFTYLSQNVRRQHINFILCLIFAGLFLGFANFVNDPSAEIVWAFYILGDMFSSAMLIFF